MQAQTAATADTRADVSHYKLMLAKLATDRQRLKTIQSITRKVEVKRELLPDYEAYVTGALESAPGVQDEVLITVMVWRIDAGDYVGALTIAEYALKKGLTLPDPYERTLATFVTEQIAEAALSEGESFDLTLLTQLAALTERHDMPDPVRAKLHKALGMVLQASDPDHALAHYRHALTLAPRCGVKKEIERLERQLTVFPQPSDAEKTRL
ncbi:hypothetical protein BGZ97_011853 [Linnemannia gamsii]|uniref:Uncharacterized protein n=1 Tax=Linnemannia gamsii TaxID=64522 RepID=A0A9P6R2S6_9FUNG|nr:hypothetical protein BGZ97_011853 [Linnemannia gamsii]